MNNHSDSALNIHAYAYNVGNQRVQQSFTAQNYMDYTYDPIGQLKTAKGKELGGVTNRWQEQFGYVYDAAGNLNWRTNHTLLQAFNVNSLNELTTETNTGRLTVAGSFTGVATNVTVNASNAFLYADATFSSTNHPWVSGNNSYTAIAKDNYGRKDTNSLSVYLGATNNYTYDLNGNLLSDGRRAFDYDDENQLIRVLVTNAWKSEFSYDGKMRRRVRKEYTWNGSWLLTNEVRYVYDGNLVIQERDANNLPQVTYTRGKDLSGSLEGAGGIGGLLARTDNSLSTIGSPLSTAYYHADGNGNVTCLINSNEVVVARYEYDPFGSLLALSGSLAEVNLYRFSSKEFHPNSGLVYYLYRYYEPSLQRWLNRDPLEEPQGINLYAYVLNNPSSAIDPLGLAQASVSGPAGLGGFSGPFNGFWKRAGGGIGALFGAGAAAIGNAIMNRCGDECSRADCESCCKKGAAAAGAGVGIGAAAGCVGTGGLGCGLSVVGGIINGLSVYDTYKACMKGCASKQPLT